MGALAPVGYVLPAAAQSSRLLDAPIQLALAHFLFENPVRRFPSMKSLEDCRLYAFVDSAYLNGRSAVHVAEQLCEGGADLIQLRAKESSPKEILRMARALRPLTRDANAGLVIND